MRNSIQTPATFSYLSLPVNNVYAVKVQESPAESLLDMLQQKSERGFSRLYDNYSDALFSVIYQIVNNKEIAEDMLQETFVKIWKKIDTYDESKGTLYTWMLNIARNTGIDFIRSQKNQFYTHLVHDDIWQNELSHPGAGMGNTDRLDYIALKNKATKLGKKYAIIIDMIYFGGYSYVQVAELLKLPVGTVKTRARMALTLLKKDINECWRNY